MNEKLSQKLQYEINNGDYNKKQKEQARKVISSTQKNLDKINISGVTSEELSEFLEILTLEGLTTNGIKDITKELIEQELNEDNSKEETTYDSQEYISDYDYNPDLLTSKYERKGWNEVYIFAKMLALGYVPTVHKGKFNTDFKGSKIKWLIKNTPYFALGGPLTNGTVNEWFKSNTEGTSNIISNMFFTEERELKMILEAASSTTPPIDKTIVESQIDALNELKNAINSGDSTRIQNATRSYTDIAEKTGGLPGLYKKHNLKEAIKKSQKEKLEISKKNRRDILEADYKNQQILVEQELENKIQNIENEIKRQTLSDNTTKQNLENDYTNKKNRHKQLLSEKEIIENNQKNITRQIKELNDDLKNESKSKKPKKKLIRELKQQRENLNNDLNIINGDLETKIIEINNKDLEVKTAKRNLESFEPTDIKKQTQLKEIYDDLVDTLRKKDHIKAKNIITKNNRLIGADLDGVITGRTNSFKNFLETDHIANINKVVDDITLSSISKRMSGEEKLNTVIDNEVSSIDKNINDIEIEINKLKGDVTKQLNELNELAKKDPSKVPELRKTTEELISKYNDQVGKLELEGINSLSKLDTDSLKLITTKNKWASGVAKANKGVDGAMSGVGGKIVGIAGMALVAHGVIGGVKENGLGWNTAKDIGDIALGMIPVVGGVYDIYRAFVGTDLNGRELGALEKKMRIGFGIVGIIPGVGVLAKGGARLGFKALGKADDIAKIAKAFQTIDAGVETVKLTGKIAGLGALGYGGVTTARYVLKK